MSRDFFQSVACQARVHCGICRQLVAGRQWRQSLAIAYALPAGAPDFACPIGLAFDAAPPPAYAADPAGGATATEVPIDLWSVRGPRLWQKLHTTKHADAAWLAGFSAGIPCGECHAHWRALLADTPPDYGNWFAWTVGAHNAVNRRLGKPEMTLADAVARWHPSPDRTAVKG